jgi:lysophospholipase L1-like esterase
MTRLPQPGGDDGSWGDILNDFLAQAHNSDGSLKQLNQSQVANLVNDLAAKVDQSDGRLTDSRPATDASVAALVNGPSTTRSALDGTYTTPAAATTLARSLPRVSALSSISGRLQRNTEDVVLAVLGDSTGNDTDEWVRLVASWLASRYPAYTVLHWLWNDTNQNYDTPTTIQAGSGSHSLKIYNASTPGKLASYSTPILAAQLPIAPHAVIMNYGHNTTATTVRPDNLTLARAVREKYPYTTIVITAQNPRIPTDPDYGNGLLRQQSNIDLAQSEGFGLINILQAFLSNPNYATDWLQPDGLHPNSNGSIRWAQEVEKHLSDDDTTIVPYAGRAEHSRVWLPATALALKSGTPTRIDTNDQGPMWSFPTTGTAVVHGVVDLPSTWDFVNVYAVWTQTTSSGFTPSNNQCRVRTRVKGLGDPGFATAPSTAAILAITSLGDVTLAANNATAGGKKVTLIGVAKMQSFSWGPTAAVEFQRLGDDALDNYIDPLLLLGIMFVRAS